MIANPPIAEKRTNRFWAQDVHVIKTDYACGYGIGAIADCYSITSAEVVYAINLNEIEPIHFTLDDFNIRS